MQMILLLPIIFITYARINDEQFSKNLKSIHLAI